MQSENDQHRAADARQPVAIAGDHRGRRSERTRGSQGHAKCDKDQRKAEDVGDSVRQDATATDAFDATG